MTILQKVLLSNLFILPFIVFDDVPDQLSGLGEQDSSKFKKKIVNWIAAFWISVVLIIGFSIVYFFSQATTFTVSANVEKLSISQFPRQDYPVWRLNNVFLHSDCDESYDKVSGRLFLSHETFIELTKIQKNDLYIDLENDSSGSAGYFLTDDGIRIALEDCSTIRVPVGESDSYVLPIEGIILIGGEIKESTAVTPVLYGGEISIIDKALLINEFYLIDPVKLEMGDIFVIDDLEVKSSGIVRVGNENGFSVNYSGRGKRGYIKKYKTENIEVKNGFWTKVYNDPSLIIIWLIWLAVYAVCRTFIRLNLEKIENT